VIRDSITILKDIPKLFVNHDMNKNTIFFVSPAKNSNHPLVELLTLTGA